MRHPARFLTIGAACLALSATPGALARQGAAGQQAAERQPAAQPATQEMIVWFDLDFPGGTVNEYVAAIRRAHPTANIVVLAGAGVWGVPPMQLRNVTVRAALGAIRQEVELPSGVRSALMVEESAVVGNPESVFTLSFVGREAPRPVRTRVWSIAEHILNGVAPEDLFGAVEVALALDPGEAQIRYHEPTALLIVRAAPAQLDVVEETLDAIINTRAILGDSAD